MAKPKIESFRTSIPTKLTTDEITIPGTAQQALAFLGSQGNSQTPYEAYSQNRPKTQQEIAGAMSPIIKYLLSDDENAQPPSPAPAQQMSRAQMLAQKYSDQTAFNNATRGVFVTPSPRSIPQINMQKQAQDAPLTLPPLQPQVPQVIPASSASGATQFPQGNISSIRDIIDLGSLPENYSNIDLTKALQTASGLQGRDVDGIVGQMTGDALRNKFGITDDNILNDLQAQAAREKVFGVGRYQFIPKSLNMRINNYNRANPTSRIDFNSPFNPATQDKIMDYTLSNLTGVESIMRDVQNGVYRNGAGDPAARLRAQRALEMAAAKEWRSLPVTDPRNKNFGGTYDSGDGNSIRKGLTVGSYGDFINGFMDSGNMESFRDFIAEGEANVDGYSSANSGSYWKYDSSLPKGGKSSVLPYTGRFSSSAAGLANAPMEEYAGRIQDQTINTLLGR